MNGFSISFDVAELIKKENERNSLWDAITFAFLHTLAKHGDTFVAIKFGDDVAEWTKEKAEQLFKNIEKNGIKNTKQFIQNFDEELIR